MMTVTRDVAKDLLPVYLSGEASTDTRRVVEALMAEDAEFARAVDAMRQGSMALPSTPAPASTTEKRALDATRQLLRHRTSTLAVATLFTLLPLSFVFRDSHLTFLLVRDAPVIAAAWWATAAVMWIWHFRIRARARVSGL